MTITPGPRRLVDVADDYSKALDTLEARAVKNTRELLRRSLDSTLATLRRSYTTYLEALGPMSRDPSGQFIRRPGSYTTAEATAKFRAILRDAQSFMTDMELQQWQARYQADLNEATTLGVELATKLTEMQRVPPPAGPDIGPMTPAEVQTLGQQLVAMAQQPEAQSPFAGVNPEAVRAAALQASAYIQGETTRFRDQIVQIVGEGASRGWGPKRLERDIRQALRGAKDPNGITKRLGLEQRAELIARSELAAAYSGGTIRKAQAEGLSYVRVLASNDERTCPTCAARNGRVFPIDRVPVPWHPRCRCVVVPCNNEAVVEKNAQLRDTLLDGERWREEHERGVEAFAEAHGLTIEQARAKLEKALNTATASEKRLFGKDATPLRESVPLHPDGPPGSGGEAKPAPAVRTGVTAEEYMQHLVDNSYATPGRRFSGGHVANLVNHGAEMPGPIGERFRELRDFAVKTKQVTFISQTLAGYAVDVGSYGVREFTKADVPWAFTPEYRKQLGALMGTDIFKKEEEAAEWLPKLLQQEKDLKTQIAQRADRGWDDTLSKDSLARVRKDIRRYRATNRDLPRRYTDAILGVECDGFTNRYFHGVVITDDATQNLHGGFDTQRKPDIDALSGSVATVLHQRRTGEYPGKRPVNDHTGQSAMSGRMREENVLYTYIHETGHQVYFRGGTPPPPSNNLGKAPTEYAETNNDELFAESFSCYVLNPEAFRKFDPALHDWVRDTYNQAMTKPKFRDDT